MKCLFVILHDLHETARDLLFARGFSFFLCLWNLLFHFFLLTSAYVFTIRNAFRGINIG